MDTRFSEYSDLSNGFKFDEENIFASPDHSQYILNGFGFNDTAPNLNFMDLPFSPDPNFGSFDPFPSLNPDGDSSDSDISDTPLLNYVRQTLMEENLEEKSCMFHDPLALQAAEKPFYEILGQKHPLSPDQPPLYSESPDESSSNSCTSTNTSTSNSVDPTHYGDTGEYNNKASSIQSDGPVEYTSNSNSQLSYGGSDLGSSVNGLVDQMDPTSVRLLLALNIFSDPDSVLQFNRGVEEASKFLPKYTPLFVDLEQDTLPPKKNEELPQLEIKVEKDEKEYSPNDSKGRKNRGREDEDLEDARSNKQSAVYIEEELSEMFDKVLLYKGEAGNTSLCNKEKMNKLQLSLALQGSNGVKARGRKRNGKTDVVDLRTLLIHCAQAISADDRRTASELLKQIRQHSSPSGDGSQRLTHYFANSLEARLAGTGSQLYTALATKRLSALSILKAYDLYLTWCPFKKMSIFYGNHMILKLASKATTLHIIDFGILYGFQWPILIQFLSKREGGPPKLRITGIELPQPGFRPSERVEETGRRLAGYCDRFEVPFEYNAIAQKWETIRAEDLEIRKDEMVVVNSLFRFKNLLDESVVTNSPRNAVLKLIREINPSLFVHGIINGSYNAPFFVTRFREALFHFSSTFDVFDTVVARENEQRSLYEREFCGREIMSVVACEGSERVERPETYKQWQVRNMRAGFRRLPLNPEIVKKLCKVMSNYHRDFAMSEDGAWLLTGWKGRVLYGVSCWVPA